MALSTPQPASIVSCGGGGDGAITEFSDLTLLAAAIGARRPRKQ